VREKFPSAKKMAHRGSDRGNVVKRDADEVRRAKRPCRHLPGTVRKKHLLAIRAKLGLPLHLHGDHKIGHGLNLD
jgi:hypothetical protein